MTQCLRKRFGIQIFTWFVRSTKEDVLELIACGAILAKGLTPGQLTSFFSNSTGGKV